MKKVLVIIPSFNHGGTNRSFTNIIDLFNFFAHGLELNVLCVKSVNQGFYYSEYINRGITILKSNRLLMALFGNKNRIIAKFIRRVPNKIQDDIVRFACKKYAKKFDIVIAMEEGVATKVASFMDSRTRIAWVRSIFNKDNINGNLKKLSDCYACFKSIVCVSNQCKKAFLNIFPEFEDVTHIVRNTQNREAIIKKSKEKSTVEIKKNYFNIVSIGRLDEVKQFHKIPQIAEKFLSLKNDFRWYIIGDGTEREHILDEIHKNKMEDQIILTGAVNNPYPIIWDADLVAVTSRSESFCNVIAESEILNTPVISTAFPAAFDTMRNRERGVICELSDFAENIERIYMLKKKEKEKPVVLNNLDENILEFVSSLEKIICQ